MSKIIWLVVLLAAVAGGYYLWHQIPDTPKSQTFTGYTQNLQSDVVKAQAAAASMNTTSVQEAVKKYKVDKGSLPASLQDLVPDFLDHVPGGLQYDPATGAVSAAQ